MPAAGFPGLAQVAKHPWRTINAAAGGIALTSGAASAMPNGLPAANQFSNVDQVRYVCDAWGRCWWRPNYYGAYGFYGGPR